MTYTKLAFLPSHNTVLGTSTVVTARPQERHGGRHTLNGVILSVVGTNMECLPATIVSGPVCITGKQAADSAQPRMLSPDPLSHEGVEYGHETTSLQSSYEHHSTTELLLCSDTPLQSSKSASLIWCS